MRIVQARRPRAIRIVSDLALAGLPAAVLPLLCAPFVGSFLGVLIRRLPRCLPIGFSRSACEHCQTVLGASELVPLASYLVQRGRCRHCGEHIARFHPAVELAALAIALAAAVLEPDGLRLWVTCGLGWVLLAIAWIDWEWRMVPGRLALPLIAAGPVVALASDGAAAAADHAGAAILGYAAVRALTWSIGRRSAGTMVEPGAATLAAAGGAWVGVAGLPAMALLTAVVAVSAEALRRYRRGPRRPIGPWLAVACWTVWAVWPTG
jgi:leader peptidase (prepilin peptidase)/N-methyltransferase